MAEKEPELRVILLGNVGEGKSATGNFILNETPFVSKQDCNLVTKTTKSSSGFLSFYERKVTVVDTPGFFDTTVPMLQTALEVHKSLDLVKPGPHAFLLVIKLGRARDETAKLLKLMNMIFGPNFSKYMIIIFTYEDQVNDLEAFKQTFMKNATMDKIIHACSGRNITLNNLEKNLETRKNKLEQLLQLVNEVSENGKNPYDENSASTRNVLERNIEEWNNTHLTGEQMEQILNEVEEEKEKRRLEEEKRRQEEEKRRREKEKRRREEEKRQQEEKKRQFNGAAALVTSAALVGVGMVLSKVLK